MNSLGKYPASTGIWDIQKTLHHGSGTTDFMPGDFAKLRREFVVKLRLNSVGDSFVLRPMFRRKCA
jgi:hypothetical protein